MNKPTEARTKKFWEWLGYRFFTYPVLDLNSLFIEYAVPRFRLKYGGEALYELLLQWVLEVALGKDKVDPALALFWLLDKVREEDKK